MDEKTFKGLGPLASLAGTWEGTSGDDTAPSDDRGTEQNKYRERMVIEPIGLTQNHEQNLDGLRYHTQAWRIGESDPFHDEMGYWLWDARSKEVMKCILIPRGVSVIAGGTVEPDAKHFKLTAKQGSSCFGICSNPFLDEEFKTIGFELEMVLHDRDSFSYDEITSIRIKDQKEPFEHRDRNKLKRIQS
ncbi:MAG TPA: heme-binding beta-barrel domain-containing protein [Candidatus Acidoferrales bacterium]|nr:heme-binding beta-barrel domain-containing protein [Candidatus Acidoferrales bacterium]